MEKSRIQGKNLFLSYTNSINKENLIVHLNNILFKFNIRYMLIGTNKFNLLAFICLEKKIDMCDSILNYNQNEVNCRISNDISNDILKITKMDNIQLQGECEHPVYLIHKIKEKEKEKEFQKNEFIQKLNEKENELNLLNEKLQNMKTINNFLNKSYERIRTHNEKFIQILTEIKSKSNPNSNVSILSNEEISEILENWNKYVDIENQNKSFDVLSI